MTERETFEFDASRYERPSLTVDVVVFAMRDTVLHLLAIRRGIPPFKGRWALPGGFILLRETVEQAAARELEEETGLKGLYLEQLYTFSDPDRDPRGRVISVAHMALLPADRLDAVQAGSDASEATWLPVSEVTSRAQSGKRFLAFDHDRIVEMALRRLRGKLEYTTLAFQLLPHEFTLTEAQRVYESILGRALDKVTFRRRLAAMELVKETPRMRRGAHRPARLYVAAPRESIFLE
jgi:8-oxo-dGTP diphosphatase